MQGAESGDERDRRKGSEGFWVSAGWWG